MITLAAEKRTVTGKQVSVLRKKGFLPAVVYGKKTKPQSISISMQAFNKVLKEAGESTLVTLSVDSIPYNVLIHDVFLDPLTEVPLHADFLTVQMDEELRTKVPLDFVGESPAVKGEGGILVKIMHEVEILALPKDLPHVIEVDISALDTLESRIVLADLVAPQGVKIIRDSDEVVALIEPPRSEEELKALETETTPVAEVVTEREEKEAKKTAEEVVTEPTE
ncbi:MAG: 50S ribosomal protein L25 [Candidatus Sungbacteria bacterium]|nr:50S ribosomal protein L25 [Candidatus Sungbacteria bacterium]